MAARTAGIDGDEEIYVIVTLRIFDPPLRHIMTTY